MDMFFITAGITLSHIPSTAASAAIGLALQERLTADMTAAALIEGFAVSTLGTLCWRAANLNARQPGVNALVYIAPALSTLWLWTLSLAAPARPLPFIIGAALAIGSNIAANAPNSRRYPHRRQA